MFDDKIRRRTGRSWLALALVAGLALTGCSTQTSIERSTDCGALGAACCLTSPSNNDGYQFTCDLGYACVNEVCEFANDIGGFVPAILTSTSVTDEAPIDDTLEDPWFVDASGPLVVGNRGNGAIAFYDGVGTRTGVLSTSGEPTGGVRNRGDGFQVKISTGMAAADVLWADETGRIYGTVLTDDGAEPATVWFDGSRHRARFTGLTLRPGVGDTGDRLYAVDASNDRIAVWDDTGRPLALVGDFIAPELEDTFRPYGIAQIEGRLWVSYVEITADGVVSRDRGQVAIFDADGAFIELLDRADVLAAPWGMAQAPASGFGDLNACTLIANSGDGALHAWCRDAEHRFTYRGPVPDEHGHPIIVEGLRGISFAWNEAGAEGPEAIAFFTARRTLGGAVGVIQVAVSARPTHRACTCDCHDADDAWQIGITVFANNVTYPGACSYGCQHNYPPPIDSGIVCTPVL